MVGRDIVIVFLCRLYFILSFRGVSCWRLGNICFLGKGFETGVGS